MKRIDEQIIERYVRWPETLSSDLQETVRAHLAEDDGARATADFYHRFYEELKEQGGPPASRLNTFLDRIFPSTRAA